jgi:hypothetical protein
MSLREHFRNFRSLWGPPFQSLTPSLLLKSIWVAVLWGALRWLLDVKDGWVLDVMLAGVAVVLVKAAELAIRRWRQLHDPRAAGPSAR